MASDADELEQLWEHQPGLERFCRDEILGFLQPLNVPRFLTARARDVILLLPRFRYNQKPGKLIRHPEYKYGRELFLLVAELFEWGDDIVSGWPAPDKARRRKSRGNRRKKPPGKKADWR